MIEIDPIFQENVSNIRFVVWDTETTGANGNHDHLAEIAAMAFDEEFTHRTFDSLVKPPIPMPAGAQAIHGISDEMLASAPGSMTVIDQFFEFLSFVGRPRVLLAHNCSFDVSILHGECRRHEKGNIQSEAPSELVLDTCMIAKSLLPDLPRHRLVDLGAHFKVTPPERYHRAMADVQILHQVFLNLLSLAADSLAARGEGLTLQSLVDISGGYFLLDRHCSQIQKKPFRLSPKLQAIDGLCGTDAQVGIVYDVESDVRYITPLEIKIRGFRVYIEAICHRENIKKTFRADRILKITLRD